MISGKEMLMRILLSSFNLTSKEGNHKLVKEENLITKRNKKVL